MVKTYYFPRKLKYLLSIIIFSSIFNIYGQQIITPLYPEETSFWDNVRFGGSVGLNFGNGFFAGALAPSAIYDFNDKFSAGTSLSGAYSKQNNFKATSFGGSLIGMFRPILGIQLSTEFEQLNINRSLVSSTQNIRENYWVPALYLGVGYNTGPVVAGVRYDVLHDADRSFYRNPFMPFVSVYF